MLVTVASLNGRGTFGLICSVAPESSIVDDSSSSSPDTKAVAGDTTFSICSVNDVPGMISAPFPAIGIDPTLNIRVNLPGTCTGIVIVSSTCPVISIGIVEVDFIVRGVWYPRDKSMIGDESLDVDILVERLTFGRGMYCRAGRVVVNPGAYSYFTLRPIVSSSGL